MFEKWETTMPILNIKLVSPIIFCKISWIFSPVNGIIITNTKEKT